MDGESNGNGPPAPDVLPHAADVVVVGGGVIGCAVAGQAARSGAQCVVLDRDVPGRGATRAAAGMLSPLAGAEREEALLEIGVRSLEAYPSFLRDVEEASGVEVGYRRDGKLQLALTSQETATLERRAGFARKWGSGTTLLEGDDLREAEPCARREAVRGLLLPDDHRLDPRRLGMAVHRWARAGGARVVPGHAVRGVLRTGDRVEGVELEGGARVRAPWVVVAAGCWSARLEGLPRPLPVEPVRGQMVALGAGPCRLRRVVESASVYVVPREDGSLLAGSTEERVGFESRTTAGGVAGILQAAMELLPDLQEHPVIRTWAGLRPGTADRLPILGPDPEVPGLLYATGHFRNGILLAPETARRLATWIGGGGEASADELFGPFGPHRF